MTECERLVNELQSRLRELKLANSKAVKAGASDKVKAAAEQAELVFTAFRERIRPIVTANGTAKDKLDFAKWENPGATWKSQG
jgi:hypothetical protein